MKTTYRLEIEVLSPLHIGSGRAELKNDVDFVCSKGVHVIDIDRALENLPAEAWARAIKGALLRRSFRADSIFLSPSIL